MKLIHPFASLFFVGSAIMDCSEKVPDIEQLLEKKTHTRM
jgi:hypothetical protein